jgi:hypothetical protein
MKQESSFRTYQLMILEFKQYLKQQGINQLQLARSSKIPLSTIKKVLALGPSSERDCSSVRFIQMVESVGLDYFTFVARIQLKQADDVFSFTMEQEQFFAKNFDYFLFFHKCYRDFLTPKQVKEQLQLADKKYWPILKKLESFNLIEVLPEEKLKFKVKGGIKYLADGPLQDLILKKTMEGLGQYLLTGQLPNYISSDGAPLDGFLRVYFGKITKERYWQFLEQFKNLHQKFMADCLIDRKLEKSQKLIDVT